MRNEDGRDRLIDIRHKLAQSSFELAAIRLAAKTGFSPDQPRVPAGNADGGQWSDGVGVAGTASGTGYRQDRVFHADDGTRISARVRLSDPDAARSYSVKLPHGTKFHFASRDGVQTISDHSGRIMRQYEWLRPAPSLLPQPLTPELEDRLFDAGRRLFNWLATPRPLGLATYPVLAFIARQYNSKLAKPTLLGSDILSREQVRQVCPRLEQVQALTDEATQEAGDRRDYSSSANYGTAIHVRLRDKIRALGDTALRTEISFAKVNDEAYSLRGSIRVDVIEDEGKGPICIYDIKTGRSQLSKARSSEFASRVIRDIARDRLVIVSEIRAFE